MRRREQWLSNAVMRWFSAAALHSCDIFCNVFSVFFLDNSKNDCVLRTLFLPTTEAAKSVWKAFQNYVTVWLLFFTTWVKHYREIPRYWPHHIYILVGEWPLPPEILPPSDLPSPVNGILWEMSELITQERIAVGSSNLVEGLTTWPAMYDHWPKLKGQRSRSRNASAAITL